MNTFQKSQASKVLSCYNNVEDILEKAQPVGFINKYGKQKQADGSWKYVGKGKTEKNQSTGTTVETPDNSTKMDSQHDQDISVENSPTIDARQEKIANLKGEIKHLDDRIEKYMNTKNAKGMLMASLKEKDKVQIEIAKLQCKQKEAISVVRNQFDISASKKSSTSIRGFSRFSKGYEIDNKYDPTLISFHSVSEATIQAISEALTKNGIQNTPSPNSIALAKQ